MLKCSLQSGGWELQFPQRGPTFSLYFQHFRKNWWPSLLRSDSSTVSSQAAQNLPVSCKLVASHLSIKRAIWILNHCIPLHFLRVSLDLHKTQIIVWNEPYWFQRMAGISGSFCCTGATCFRMPITAERPTFVNSLCLDNIIEIWYLFCYWNMFVAGGLSKSSGKKMLVPAGEGPRVALAL